MIAFAIMSIFNAKIGKLHQKIREIIKQKWYKIWMILWGHPLCWKSTWSRRPFVSLLTQETR